MPVDEETIAHLRALLTGDWAVATASSAHARRRAAGLVASFTQWYLERGLRSLPLVERTFLP